VDVAGGGGSSEPVQGLAVTPASAAASAPPYQTYPTAAKLEEMWHLVKDLKLPRKQHPDGWMVELPAAANAVLSLPKAPILIQLLDAQQVDKVLAVLRREKILMGTTEAEDAGSSGGSFVTDKGKRVL
jgi:hypothetical protein